MLGVLFSLMIETFVRLKPPSDVPFPQLTLVLIVLPMHPVSASVPESVLASVPRVTSVSVPRVALASVPGVASASVPGVAVVSTTSL
jgi:hypothetical protein